MNLSNIVPIAIQVVAGLVFAFLAYYASLVAIRKDKLVMDKATDHNPRVSTLVLDGYADSVMLQKREYNTILPMANNYAHMPRSYNRKGGAQYTYMMWILVDDPAHASNKAILQRGDIRQYSVDVYRGDADVESLKRTVLATETALPIPADVEPKEVARKSSAVVANPRIAFGDSYEDLHISFNTTATPFNDIHVLGNHHTDDTLRRGALKLIAHKWALLTFQFEDNVPINEFEDGVLFRFYLNDIIYYTKKAPGALKLNDGNLYMFPDGGVAMCKIGDLRYFNYAVGMDNIRSIYEAGPPRKQAVLEGVSNKADHLWFSEYNKMDIYNA